MVTVRAAAYFAASLSAAACSKDLGVMTTKFHCKSDSDCSYGWACDPALAYCMPYEPDGGEPAADAGAAPCGFDADFSVFFDSAQFQLDGAAADIINLVRLTPAMNQRRGAIWSMKRFPARKFGYEMEFSIGGGTGGDGMTMAWVTDTATVVGEGYASLGAAGLNGYYLEIDTFENGWDPEHEHVSLIHTYGRGQPDVEIVATSTAIGEVRNNGHHVVRIDFHDGLAEVSFGRLSILTATIAGYAPFEATFGATAATGDLDDTHDVHRLSLKCD
jgi:lectin family protein